MKRFFIVLAVSLIGGLWGSGDTLAPVGSSSPAVPLAPLVPEDSLGSSTLLFTGDILLDRGVRQFTDHFGADRLFSPSIDSLLADADIVVGNLECPATTITSPSFKRFVFRAEPEWLDVLKRHGFTHLNLANNHSIDQGRSGLMDTQQNILRAGMTPVGAGHDMAVATQPMLLTSIPCPVYLLTSCRLPLENYAYLPDQPCVSQESLDSLLNRIATLKAAEPRAVIIVNLHWGAEYAMNPLPQQRMEAHRIIDAGADALIGHHTHTLQPTEYYRGKLICYGIGNFIFDQQKPQNSHAAVVKIQVVDDSVDCSVIPIEIRRCVPDIIKLATLGSEE